MDRRQRKTREAIFEAFAALLSEKNVNQITVGDIIARADIGRATFYAHFETKDFLLKELAEELFCHVFEAMGEQTENHTHIFDCEAPDAVFLHLFYHLQNNDHHILDLLSCQNNDLFLRYFKQGLMQVIAKQYDRFAKGTVRGLPKDFWIHHVASTFVTTVGWWLDNHMQPSPEVIHTYFLRAIEGDGW